MTTVEIERHAYAPLCCNQSVAPCNFAANPLSFALMSADAANSSPSEPRRLYLETMGCQMNVLDSELVLGQLKRLGYVSTDDMKSADVVLLNTCSVRQHAEDKALSRLGHLKNVKQRKRDAIIGVIGCMAERDPDGIIDSMPHVNLICGPGELNKIPAMIEEIREGHQRVLALAQSLSRKSTLLQRAREFDSLESLDLSREPQPGESLLQSYIRVQRGCDKFCTFCVVPFTRGPERSRPAATIVQEARMLVDRGAKEITLVGQTVNSYMHEEDGRPVSFADLLGRVNDVPGVERVRFVTSYPGDWDDSIFQAMRDLPHVCEYLHIPVQSGHDAVLQRMRRQYSVSQYEELLARAREMVPGISIASDFIVGFCGETDEEFEATVQLVQRCKFKNIFCFKYSPRPGTVADKRLEDDISEAVKRQRNNRLLAVQNAISMELNKSFLGREVEVLVEGYSKAAIKAQEAEQSRGQEVGWRRSDQLVGRTRCDRIVVFPGTPQDIGRLARVRITGMTALTLFGELAKPEQHGNGRELSLSITSS